MPPASGGDYSAGAPSRVTPRECLAIAESYRTHVWHPRPGNIRHGPDPDGITVDTPDIGWNQSGALPGWWIAGQPAEGIPYQWGGFASLEDFDRDVAAGLAAGDVYTPAKRQLLYAGVSRHATGIDCSGFVSRCWRLPRAYSTRELPALCRRISWDELAPGDIVNTHNSHCLLFQCWDTTDGTRLVAYETGSPPTWKVLRHSISPDWLKAQGYQPWRYRGMTPDV